MRLRLRALSGRCGDERAPLRDRRRRAGRGSRSRYPVCLREWLSVLRWPGARGRGAGEGRRHAPPRAGGRAGRGPVTADLTALRARIAAIAARPRGFSTPSSSTGATSPSPAGGGGQGGGASFKALPANCAEELTPFGPVLVRREGIADQGDGDVGALATCLGLAPDELRRPLFLDTETTGLSGGTGTVAFMVGLAWRDGNGLRLVQYFLGDFNQQNALRWAVGQCT